MAPRTRVLITGAGGFVGRALVERLQGEHVVKTIDGRERFDEELSNAGTVDVVIHAGFDVDFGPYRVKDGANVANTRRVIDWVASRRLDVYLVFVGAAGTLGVSARDAIRGEGHLGTTDPGFEAYMYTQYIQDKLACERMLDHSGLSFCSVLPSTIHGPGMAPLDLPTLPVVPAGGTSYLGLEDFLSGMTAVLAQRPTGRYVLSSGNVTFRQLYALRHPRVPALRVSPDWRPVVEWVAERQGMSRGVVTSSLGFKYYSAERARKAFGFQPRQQLSDLWRYAAA